MKKFKYLSAKIIFGLLCIALCSSIIGFANDLYNLVYAFIKHQPLANVTGLPVLMHIEKQFAFRDFSQTAFINNCVGSLNLSSAPYSLQLFLSVYRLILTLSIILCLFLMLKIIRTVFTGNPFIRQNGKRLKLLSLIVVLVPVALQVSANIVINKIISQLNFANLTLSSEVMGRSTLTVCIFAGLLLFVVSEVFRIGSLMKEEQELTV